MSESRLFGSVVKALVSDWGGPGSIPSREIFSYAPLCYGRCTQVNRMSRSRRVLAIGGKQRFFGLDMVFIETILFHLESF